MTELADLLRPRGRTGSMIWLAGTIALGVTAWLAIEASSYVESLAQEAAAIDRLRAADRRPAAPKLSHDDRERERRLIALQAERDFRWYPVFKALEEASSTEIELLEFAPDKVNRTFVLRGEARDMEALLAYLAALSEQDAFGTVYLAHQKLGWRGSLAVQTFEIRGRIR